MDHKNITLESTFRLFEFEKLSRDIDSIGDLDTLREVSKTYLKLYLKQQEVLFKL
jgi:hypothetical protein